MSSKKKNQLLLWLFLGVVFALSPLACNFLLLRVDGKPATILELCSRGELFLISAAIAADALGKLFNQSQGRAAQIVCGIGCVYLLFWASVEFAMVAPKLSVPQSYNSVGVAWDSIWVFAFTIAAGMGAVLISEE